MTAPPGARRPPSGTRRTTRGGVRPVETPRWGACPARIPSADHGSRGSSVRTLLSDPHGGAGLLLPLGPELDQGGPQPSLDGPQRDPLGFRDLAGRPPVEIG